jgi:hypothetical protein
MSAVTAKSKKNNWSYIFIVCALVVVAAIGFHTVSTPDTYMHLVTGRAIAQDGIPRVNTLSYSMPDAEWVSTSWLYDVILYRVWQIGGATLATLLTVASVLGAFILLLPVARRWAGELPAALSLLLCAWLAAPLFRVTPSMATLIFPALFIALFSRRINPLSGVIGLIVAQVFWTNLSATFLWGPVIALIFTAQAYFGSSKDKSLTGTLGFSKMLMLTAGLFVATLFNPYFITLHKAVLSALSDPAILAMTFWIAPNNELTGGDITGLLRIIALIAGAGGLIAQREKLPIALTSLAVLTAFLVVRSFQASALFAIMAFPFLSLCMNALGRFISERFSRTGDSPLLTNIARAAVILLAVFSLYNLATNAYYLRTGNTSSFGLGQADNVQPTPNAIAFIEEHVPAEKAVNTYFYGPMLKWNIPEFSLFTDTRGQVYGIDFYRNLMNGLNGSESQVFFSRWQPQAVILDTTYPQAGNTARILTANGWALVYFDGLTAVYMPRTREFAQLITDREIKKTGLALLNEQLDTYRNGLGNAIRPALPVNLIGAANLLLANGNYKEAASIFATITRGVPTLASAWLNLGRCQLELDNPEKATVALTRAAELLPENPFVLVQLAHASEAAGDSEKAQQLYLEAAQINPELTTALREDLEPGEGKDQEIAIEDL